jgi:hypothetical protein
LVLESVLAWGRRRILHLNFLEPIKAKFAEHPFHALR